MKFSRIIITACTAVVIVASALSVVANAQVAYDINMDSKADINDVTALQKFICKSDLNIDETKADVNNDKKIDVRDVSALQIILNKTTPTESSTEIPKETEDIGGLI